MGSNRGGKLVPAGEELKDAEVFSLLPGSLHDIFESVVEHEFQAVIRDDPNHVRPVPSVQRLPGQREEHNTSSKPSCRLSQLASDV